MAKDNKIQLPGGFGGLMHYNEEYSSYLKLKPAHVVGFVVLIIAFRVILPLVIK
jgi:preprotein translocase subunit Sec61beta